MSLLLSNYQPVKTSLQTFSTTFDNLLHKSSTLKIASGYISEKSIEYLSKFLLNKGGPKLDLIIGMHYFDKFTYSQYNAAIELEKFLQNNSLGSVHLVTSFPFHGKLYSFNYPNNSSTCLLGSSNLDNILPHKSKVCYETDFKITDKNSINEIENFINQLYHNASEKLSEVDIKSFRQTNDFLEELSDVTKIESPEIDEIRNQLNDEEKILIPLKPFEVASKSNLHPYLGKGRENKSTGLVLPRSWYEVELIVPKQILDMKIYPDKSDIILVTTDDGYQFKCRTSGDNGKNLRSDNDLKTLGKWIKGRMQEKGILKAGEKITRKILANYGRNNIAIYPISENEWFFDFNTEK